MPLPQCARRLLALGLLAVAVGCGDASLHPPRAVGGGIVDLQGRAADPLGEAAPAKVLLFVSTHCPVSNRYAPTIQALFDDWQADGVATYLVYPDPDDTSDAIAAHRDAYGLTVPAVRDPMHVLVARAGAKVTPEAAVFTRDGDGPAYRGRIDDRVVELGKVRPTAGTHELRDAVAAVVAGKPPAVDHAPAVGCYISDLR